MVTIADSHTIVEPYMPEPIDKAATGELDDVIANGLGNPSPIITISSSDVGFSSDRCGTWTLVP